MDSIRYEILKIEHEENSRVITDLKSDINVQRTEVEELLRELHILKSLKFRYQLICESTQNDSAPNFVYGKKCQL
ncbi:UvrABC system protein C [Frankliniella fusca]|uniref:UvrABC system protein C n=1 Tax=Frankliniella fusca TaxID=407009 RepID=A0AAE1LI02_9NEOP|nr:UvrABC system protein C [Frankliniella fusca]